jgi:crotonobetaine/carnitine-CoA ligase
VQYPGIRELDYTTIVGRRAREDGARTYLRFEDEHYTFLDAHRLTNRVGSGLMQHGVARGEHVALMLDNCPEIAWYFFGIGKIGAVSVPLNTATKGELLARFLRQSRASCIVVASHLLERIVAVAAQCPELKRCVVVTGRGAAQADEATAAPGLASITHHELMKAADGDPGVPVRFDDLACLMFTSGTSGPSKAIMSTHAHSFSPAIALAKAFDYGPDEVMYTCLPLFHGNAMRSLFIAMITGGSVAVGRKFSASNFFADVRHYKATQFNLLGAMANILWAQAPSPAERDHGASKCMIVPMPAFAEPFSERFGLQLCSTYALTDFAYVSFLSTADPKSKWRSAGRVQPDIEMAILDEDDFAVTPGATGEICIRSRRPWIAAQGYYGMPEATIAAWRNLWFHTGDRGYLDCDGYLFFVDRKKDAIRRRGENISSYEVEQIIGQHPAVLDVAAFAVASEMSEDEVMVSVVLRPGEPLGEEELVRWCARQMAYFMVPRYIEFLPALPRTLTEKVEKYKLRAAAEQRLASVWDREKHGIKLAR